MRQAGVPRVFVIVQRQLMCLQATETELRVSGNFCVYITTLYDFETFWCVSRNLAVVCIRRESDPCSAAAPGPAVLGPTIDWSETFLCAV